MKARILLTVGVLTLGGWFTFAPANTIQAASYYSYHATDNQWYQGQRGQWYRDRGNAWRWKSAQGDEWYQGQRGHWYQEGNPSAWQWRGDMSEQRRWARANARHERRHNDYR